MLNTSAKRPNEGTTEYYGHADYNRDKASGMSDAEIKRLIDADPSKMGNGGVGGDLYKQIAAGAGRSNSGSGNNPGQGSYNPPSFNPPEINFNPSQDDTWSNESFVRELAKERAQNFKNSNISSENTINNKINQDVGKKGDQNFDFDNTGTIYGSVNNSNNDYSLNLGQINNQNRIFSAI